MLSMLVVLLLLLIAAPAFAEDQEAAVQLAGEASAAFEKGDYVTAAEKFSEAYVNYPDHSLKMNEMVSWYKARRCESALEIAREVTTSGRALGDRDKVDLGRVNTECGFDEAKAMYDAGDLDGAEARLALVETNNADLAVRIGELRGSIKERRKLAAQVVEEPEIEPAPQVSPPAAWTRPLGFGLVATGLGGVGGVVIKHLIERENLEQWRAIATEHDCVFSQTCTADNFDDTPDGDEVSWKDYQTAERQVRVANTTTVLFATLSGVGIATGTGLLIYYYTRRAKYEEATAPAETAMTPLLVPTFGPDFAGATFSLRF